MEYQPKPNVDPVIRAHMRALGAVGGKTMSEARREANARNAKRPRNRSKKSLVAKSE